MSKVALSQIFKQSNKIWLQKIIENLCKQIKISAWPMNLCKKVAACLRLQIGKAKKKNIRCLIWQKIKYIIIDKLNYLKIGVIPSLASFVTHPQSPIHIILKTILKIFSNQYLYTGQQQQWVKDVLKDFNNQISSLMSSKRKNRIKLLQFQSYKEIALQEDKSQCFLQFEQIEVNFTSKDQYICLRDENLQKLIRERRKIRQREIRIEEKMAIRRNEKIKQRPQDDKYNLFEEQPTQEQYLCSSNQLEDSNVIAAIHYEGWTHQQQFDY